MASVDCLESGSLGRARKGSEETVLDSWSHRVLRQVDLLSVCGDGHSVPTQPPNRTTNPSKLLPLTGRLSPTLDALSKCIERRAETLERSTHNPLGVPYVSG